MVLFKELDIHIMSFNKIKNNEALVGVLGGMGPYATLDFLKHIYDNTPNVNKEWDHLRIITDLNVKLPSRTRALLFNEESPVHGMINAINKMANCGVDLVAVPCNSAHYFYNEVNTKINVPWLNMIQVINNVIIERGLKAPLIIGGYVTVTNKIYRHNLINYNYLQLSENEFIYQLIEKIKSQHDISDNDIQRLHKIMRSPEIDSIVLACTELTQLVDSINNRNVDIIDTSLEYARGIVNKSINHV